MTKTEEKLDATWRSAQRAKPLSRRRDRLERDMVMLQVKRMKEEIRALQKRKA